MKPLARKILPLIFGLLAFLPQPALAHGIHKAPISTSYNGKFISDTHFRAKANMNVTEIQAFLKAKGSALATYKIPVKAMVGPEDTINAKGWTAAQIIYYSARWYNINPQVILATLQKESSLVTSGNLNYINTAMGYACPETNGCNPVYANFAKQVDGATWQFNYNFTHSEDLDTQNYVTPYFKGNNATIDGKQTLISNSSTAALYRYTPHRPDSAWLTATNGSHYYGNYNFIYYINLWFPEVVPSKISLNTFRITMENTVTPADIDDYVLADFPAVGEPISVWASLKNSNDTDAVVKNLRIKGKLSTGTEFVIATIPTLTLPAGKVTQIPVQTFNITSFATHTFSIDYYLLNIRRNPYVKPDYSYQKIKAHYPNVKVVKTPVITPSTPKIKTPVMVTYKLKNYDSRPAFLKSLTMLAKLNGKIPYYFPKIDQKILPGAVYQYAQSIIPANAGTYSGTIQITYGNGASSVPSTVSGIKNTVTFRVYP